MASSTPYQTAPAQMAGTNKSGMQRSCVGSIIGKNQNIDLTLPGMRIGASSAVPIPGYYVAWDGLTGP